MPAALQQNAVLDGLPDDIEHAIGTALRRADTDGNGLDDFAEIQQGLDPFGGRPVATGILGQLPLSGEAQQVLVLAIDPALETAWASTRHGWGELLAKAGSDRAHVKRYLVTKLTEKANESNVANRYKPFRDLISELHVDAALAPGSDPAAARALLFEAAQETDRAVGDKLPDFLYNWVNPPATS